VRVCWGMVLFTVNVVQAKPSAGHDSPAILIEMADRLPLVHEDVATAVLEVIPPRRVPLGKRIFWRLILWVMKSSAGRKWIARRYGPSRII